MRSFIITLVITLLTLFSCPETSATETWKQAIGPRTWSFPRDHGAHPEFRTEWWYFTGNLRDGAGNRYGYQLTFFRHGVRLKPANPGNPWSLRDLYPAHFAVTDVRNGSFRFAEQVTRSGPGLSGAAANGMNVWNLGWSAKMKGDTIHLQAAHEGTALSLVLKPRKPLTLQGEKGLSRKGPGEGQASYYYSFTDMATTGTIKTPDMQMPVAGGRGELVRPGVRLQCPIHGPGRLGLVLDAPLRRPGPDALFPPQEGRNGGKGILGDPRGARRQVPPPQAGRNPDGSSRDLEEPQKRRRPTPTAGGSAFPGQASIFSLRHSSRTRSSTPRAQRASLTGKAQRTGKGPPLASPSPARATWR